MAYKVKREKLISQDLEIENIDGSVKTYVPKISIDTIAREYKDLIDRVQLIQSEELADENKYEELGKIITQILCVVFDAEQTKDMIATFEDNYITLIVAVVPYLKEVILPEIAKIKEERLDKYRKLADETL